MVNLRAEGRVKYLMHSNAWATGSLRCRLSVCNRLFLLDPDDVWLQVN